MAEPVAIPKRILSSLLASVSAGVVPRMGAPYIAIGRTDEIEALLGDLELAAEGGASMRFIIGRYGSGKSFLLQLMRGYALERGFVAADADLSPERKICGGKGAGVATYRELLRNLSSKASPDGGALAQILARWLSSLQADVAAGGILPSDRSFETELARRIFAVTRELETEIGGFDFAAVLCAYYTAAREGSDEKRSACLRWLRGEYATKTEAKAALGVGSIIDDDNWYAYIKLLAVFLRKIGYAGLVVIIDECVNLYKIPNRISRENNYEKLLSMFNDTLQGKASGLTLLFGGTPQFLEDTRRGLFSYEALRSRLCDGQFSGGGYKNLLGPVIRLRRLSDDELFALISRLARLHGQNYHWEPRITQEEMTEFLRICTARAGADSLITPREILRDFCTVLNILLQNREATFAEVAGSGVITLSLGGTEDGETTGAGQAGQETVAPEAGIPGRAAGESAKNYELTDIEF